MHRSVAALLLALLSAFACAPLSPAERLAREINDPRPRLCVTNEGVTTGMITVRIEGGVSLRVLPGETVCKRFTAFSGGTYLSGISIGGGLKGPTRYGIQMPTGRPGECWSWRLTDSHISSIDLVPCELRRGQAQREVGVRVVNNSILPMQVRRSPRMEWIANVPGRQTVCVAVRGTDAVVLAANIPLTSVWQFQRVDLHTSRGWTWTLTVEKATLEPERVGCSEKWV